MTESLWGDEAFSALAVMMSFPEMIGVVMRDTARRFLYCWLLVGPDVRPSEAALRSSTWLLMLGSAVFAV